MNTLGLLIISYVMVHLIAAFFCYRACLSAPEMGEDEKGSFVIVNKNE